MKVLFVSSGNSALGISSIVKNQGDSINKYDCVVEYFTIKKKGIFGYLKNIVILRKHLKNNNYDIVHAHYSLSAFVATISGARPLIVSLMGSDAYTKPLFKVIIRIFQRFCWKIIILKSIDMKKSLGLKNAIVIPNGVDFDKFGPMDSGIAIRLAGWDSNKKHVLFAASPKRWEKNYDLAKKAFDVLSLNNVELHTLEYIPNQEMPFYYNAANVVLLSSLWEGSPNVIKEAMACNRPIVATDVGDIKWLLGDSMGCYLAKFDTMDYAKKIQNALTFGKRTNGKERMIQLQLDSKSVAKKIINIYNSF